MSQSTRIGIVGCGGVARQHAQTVATIEGAAVASVYDVRPEAAKSLADTCGAQVAQSIEQMIDAHKPDAVIVCTPPARHLESCRPFIDARVPILCEKPLEATLPAALELAQLVQRSGALLVPAFCHRFHPAIIEVKKLLAQGALGRPVLFRNVFGGYFNIQGNHRATPALSGGGVLIDNGCHAIDLFHHLLGQARWVWASATAIQGTAVEDVSLMELGGDEQVLGHITSTYSTKVCGNYVEVYGTEGAAIVSYWNPGEPDLVWRRGDDAEWKAIECGGHPERFAGQARHFLECVHGMRAPRVTVDDGLNASRVVAGAYESIRGGQRQQVDA